MFKKLVIPALVSTLLLVPTVSPRAAEDAKKPEVAESNVEILVVPALPSKTFVDIKKPGPAESTESAISIQTISDPSGWQSRGKDSVTTLTGNRWVYLPDENWNWRSAGGR